jgi:hypothetical protein
MIIPKSFHQDGITPLIPGRANRKKRICYDKQAGPQSSSSAATAELKDFRRFATRYDKLTRDFLSSVCLVAGVVHWM